MSVPQRDSVGILAVGDELLAGAHPDLNSPYLARRLAEHGLRVREVRSVCDDEVHIAAALTELAGRHALVIASGGLGPTADDVTRHGAARAAGVPLVHSEEAWAQVRAWFTRAGREMPASNKRQALTPAGAVVLENPAGTAPGFRCALGRSTLLVLPGPPREVEAIYAHAVEPWLAANPAASAVYGVRRFHMADLSESVFADGVGDWMLRDANPLMGVTVKGGVLSVRLIAHGPDDAAVQALLEERGAALLALYGERVFSERHPEPAFALGEQLIARGVSVTCAESCTGGLVAAELCRVPGISAVLREAYVAYADESKTSLLGVPPELLAAHGAVSSEVAAAMAHGAAQRAGARLALAVTGIAGPDGGTPEKPVGLVWFGVALDGRVTTSERRWPSLGRDKVRGWATAKALSLGFEALRRS